MACTLHKLQSLVPVIAGRCNSKELSSFNGSVAESVSTNKRKGAGQRELQEEAGKSLKKKYSCKYQQTWEKDYVSYVEVIKGMSTLNVILAE